MQFSVTLIIIIITSLVSVGAFSNQKLMDDLIFYPPAVKRGQVYRFITHGLIHLDAFHLIFNMLALYSFGIGSEYAYGTVEKEFGSAALFGDAGKFVYLGMYVSALIVASIPDYLRHRNSYHYRSLGASGAVSAVIFSAILFNPNSGISLAFLPNFAIPGYIFGILYLIVSSVLAKRGGDNIGHMAHITGAIYGLVFTYVATKLFTDTDIISVFWSRITGKA
jgi:membrane associated rhomboid family serine protease